jgi:hypothetical protein
MKTHLAALLLLTAGLVPSALQAEKRVFIDQAGRPLEGELVTASGDTVTIKRSSDGQTFTMKASNFSKNDQAYFVSKGGSLAPTAAAAVQPAAPAPSVGSTSAKVAPMRMEVKVYPNKNQKSRNYYYDDKVERIGYRVDIRNGEQQREFKGGKAVIMAFAENLEDRSEGSVIIRDEFDVNLQPLATMTHDSKEAKLMFDNVGYKYGYKYSGYILVLKDATGNVVDVSASSATVAKFADAILSLKEHDGFDKNYKFAKYRKVTRE